MSIDTLFLFELKGVKNVARKKRKDIPKKECNNCKKVKSITHFYAIDDSPFFPDGRLNTCKDCINEMVNFENIDEAINFLRQIDKPFKKEEWERVIKNKDKKNPLGSYLGAMRLHQYKGQTFAHSDGINNEQNVGNIDVKQITTVDKDEIMTETGQIIKFNDELVRKWGPGYSKSEYLQLEKFFEDMKITHDVNIKNATHVDMLKQLAYLSIDRDRLRRQQKWSEYKKVSEVYDKMLAVSGFRPIDNKSLEDKTGWKSFSQIFEEVEKRGFRKPPPVEFNEDIVDKMIVVLLNYYHRLVGKEILTEVPEDVKAEFEGFYSNSEQIELHEEQLDEIEASFEEYLAEDDDTNEDDV